MKPVRPTAVARKHDPAIHPIAALTESQRTELLQSVLDRALNDEKLADIAKDIGVSRSGINQALLKHAEEDWKSVQIARALTEYQTAEEDLAIAPDILSVARARERVRSAQWQLERLHRRLFGQDQQVSSGSQVQINIGIVRGPKQDNGQVDANVQIIQAIPDKPIN